MPSYVYIPAEVTSTLHVSGTLRTVLDDSYWLSSFHELGKDVAKRDKDNGKNQEWSSGDEWRGLHDLLTLISKKWAVAVLLTLRPRPLRYAQLQRAIGCGNVKTMTVTLKSLEEAGLIERKVLDGRPPGVKYEISVLGRSLIGSLDPVRKWSVDNDFDANTLAGCPMSN